MFSLSSLLFYRKKNDLKLRFGWNNCPIVCFSDWSHCCFKFQLFPIGIFIKILADIFTFHKCVTTFTFHSVITKHTPPRRRRRPRPQTTTFYGFYMYAEKNFLAENSWKAEIVFDTGYKSIRLRRKCLELFHKIVEIYKLMFVIIFRCF